MTRLAFWSLIGAAVIAGVAGLIFGVFAYAQLRTYRTEQAADLEQTRKELQTLSHELSNAQVRIRHFAEFADAVRRQFVSMGREL